MKCRLPRLGLHRGAWAALVACVALFACSGSGAGGGVSGIGFGLRGPSGLQATRYATGLTSVSALAFDSEGHLWAATADFNDAGRDAVYLIPKSDAAPIKVVSDLHTPIGLLWIGSSLYVSSHASVDVYTKFDGSTFAEHRRIVELPAGVGTPGAIAVGPDTRLQIGVSAPCDACTPTVPYAGAVVSFAADGSDLQVFARNIRAPVGLAYLPGTDDLFVTMNQRDDLGAQTPGDWLALVRKGDDWQFPACYGQGGDACRGAPSAVAVLDPHAAVSAVAFMPVTGTTAARAMVAEWATGTVLQVALTPAGAAYTSVVTPYVQGLKNPVGLATDASALYVGEWSTGVIYRIARQ